MTIHGIIITTLCPHVYAVCLVAHIVYDKLDRQFMGTITDIITSVGF